MYVCVHVCERRSNERIRIEDLRKKNLEKKKEKMLIEERLIDWPESPERKPRVWGCCLFRGFGFGV